MASLGVHGCTVITCVTAQNTVGVQATYPLPAEAVGAQLRSLREDIEIAAAKTGMLYSRGIVEAVAAGLKGTRFPLVVDPVMVATVGAPLHVGGFREALLEELLPRAHLVTPNLDEAEALTGRKVRDVAGMEAAARALHRVGAKNVLVKGGHLRGELVDVLLADGHLHRFRGHRFPKDLHGSGCVLSALITAGLARGWELVEAVDRARRRVASGFAEGYAVGHGVEVVEALPREDRHAVWRAVVEATAELVQTLPVALVPEVGINIAYALPGATTLEEVCGLQGRIVRVGHTLQAPGFPEFGASRHVARIVLAAMAFDPTVRCALNLKHTPELVAACRRRGLRVGTFDRSRERRGSSTMEWGTRRAIEELDAVPDVIYDRGGHGKVPMVRVLGRDPADVVAKVSRVLKAR